MYILDQTRSVAVNMGTIDDLRIEHFELEHYCIRAYTNGVHTTLGVYNSQKGCKDLLLNILTEDPDARLYVMPPKTEVKS